MAAMAAGEAAGGDRRGKQSAAMLVTTTEDFPDLNLRVDDHADPLGELARCSGSGGRPIRRGAAGRRPRPIRRGADMEAIEAGWKAQGLDLRFRR